MSTLTERITNGVVKILAQDIWTMSRFQLHLNQADHLTAGAGTRGVTGIFTLDAVTPSATTAFAKEVAHERFLLV